MSISSLDSKSLTELSRHVPILGLSASHLFGVLLHYSVDEVTLKDWTDVLSSALASSCEDTKWFVHETTKRTKIVNDNWLQIYASDCPEIMLQLSAIQVIACSLRNYTSHLEEIAELKLWTQAQIQQLNA